MDLSDFFLEPALEARKNPNKMNSVLTGTVKKNYDSKHPGCILVELHYGEKGKTDSEWIPVMQPYCGKAYGEYFIPEIETEVVLGFILGDVNRPIVMGCLWNEKDEIPADSSNKDNSIKRIKTKAGHEILFDETDKGEKLQLITKGKNTLILDDGNKKLTLKDSNGDNEIAMDLSSGELTIKAKTKITLKAGAQDSIVIGDGILAKGSKVSAEASQDLKLKGLNIAAEGQIGCNIKGTTVEVKGSGTGTFDGGGMTTIKGGMVKIN